MYNSGRLLRLRLVYQTERTPERFHYWQKYEEMRVRGRGGLIYNVCRYIYLYVVRYDMCTRIYNGLKNEMK